MMMRPNRQHSWSTALFQPTTFNMLLHAATRVVDRIPSLLTANPDITKSCVYMISANILYLARRANLRKVSMRTILHYRTEREPGVTIPMYIKFLIAWQSFVLVFPLLEPLARLCLGCCCLFYSYPNADGFGFILEPVNIQQLPLTKRSKQQIRLDWHRFSVNVGAVGRDGYRHPPSREINRPHIDAPQWGVKHWPWRFAPKKRKWNYKKYFVKMGVSSVERRILRLKLLVHCVRTSRQDRWDEMRWDATDQTSHPSARCVSPCFW